jgi:siroheme decarboxylase
VELTAPEWTVLAGLQRGLDITARPFQGLAQTSPEHEVISLIDSLISRGVVRRVAGILDHRRLGFDANALLVAEVDGDQIPRAAQALPRMAMVSHCYQRDPFPGWPYTLYAMLHSQTASELSDAARHLEESGLVRNVMLLETVEELKKSPVVHSIDQTS